MCVDRMTVWLPASDLMRARISVICLGIEPDGRLVEDQHLGIIDDGLGQAHPLAIPLGQGADEPVLHVGDEAPVHHLRHPRPALPPRDALHLGHEVEVGGHPHVRVQGHVLREIADPLAHLQRLAEDVEAGHPRGAAAGRHEAGENAHGRRLPRPVGAEETHDGSRRHAEGHVANGGHGTVVLGQCLDFDHAAGEDYTPPAPSGPSAATGMMACEPGRARRSSGWWRGPSRRAGSCPGPPPPSASLRIS